VQLAHLANICDVSSVDGQDKLVRPVLKFVSVQEREERWEDVRLFMFPPIRQHSWLVVNQQQKKA
jgi:hypothetical protein